MPTSPAWVWWQRRLTPWDEATVHVSELGWSAVGAVFEGIRAYWNDQHGELYVFRLEEHCDRLLRSARAVRLPLLYTADELADVTITLLPQRGARGHLRLPARVSARGQREALRSTRPPR